MMKQTASGEMVFTAHAKSCTVMGAADSGVMDGMTMTTHQVATDRTEDAPMVIQIVNSTAANILTV
jgi:hypothetical protein